LTFGIVISKSFKDDEEKRMEAWNGVIGRVWPGGLVEEEAEISCRGFEELGKDPLGSIDEFPRLESMTQAGI
jgi:hypothetical protein